MRFIVRGVLAVAAATALSMEASPALAQDAAAPAPIRPAFAEPIGAEFCFVDFNSQAALESIPDMAEFTFAPWWFEECFSNGSIFIEPTKYGHFHASYEDPTINCLDTRTGKFGRPDGTGACIPLADPSEEPRRLDTHRLDEVLRITNLNIETGLPQPLGVATIHVGPKAIQYRFFKNNKWSSWTTLNPGVRDVSSKIKAVLELQIRGRVQNGNTAGPFTIESFDFRQ